MRASIVLRIIITSACSLLVVRSARADAPPAEPDEMARLHDDVAALRKAQADLEARVAAQEEREEQAKKRPVVTVSGLVHADWIVNRQSSENEVDSQGHPLNENRFLIRRARLRAESDQGLVHGVVMIDANTVNGPEVRPYDIEASIKWPAERPYPVEPLMAARDERYDPYVVVSAGLLLTPFGYELQEMDYTRPFLERSTISTALFPSPFDLGLRGLGGWRMVHWQLGIMNGDPIGEAGFPGRDPNKSKDLLFHLGAGHELSHGVRLEAGVSGLTGRGFHEGTPATKDQITWRDQNEDGIVQLPEIQVVPGSPATPSESFDRFALGADARLEIDIPVVGKLAARAEIVRAKNLDRGLRVADPVAAGGRDLRELGWHVGATQELTRWGMIGVRYDFYDPDADAQLQQPFALVPTDTSYKTLSFMAAVRFGSHARLVAQYDHRGNSLGRDAAGNPTTLADDSLTFRAEARF